MSVHGIYRERDDLTEAGFKLLPKEPAVSTLQETRAAAGEILHPKYAVPAHCSAYVGNAANAATWKLPYRAAAVWMRSHSLRRLSCSAGSGAREDAVLLSAQDPAQLTGSALK